MIDINLLSPAKKQELKEKESLYFLRRISYFFVFFLIFDALILLTGQYILNYKTENIRNEITQIIQNLPVNSGHSINKVTEEINAKISALKDSQSEYVKWSEFLADLNQLVPEDITLNRLSLDQKSGQIQITGHAGLRDNFLNFKSNLEKSELVSGLNSPLSNIIKNQDISFVLTAQIVLDKYIL